MIVYKDSKGYEIVNTKPNENIYPNKEVYIIDETIEEGMLLRDKIINLYPNFDFILDENDNLIDVEEYSSISYMIDKTQITTSEISTINILSGSGVIAIINNEEYLVEDTIIEYSNQNIGVYQIILKANGYKDTVIEIEVI